MTPELATLSPNYHTTPTGGLSALDRFNMLHCPTRRVFSGTGLELLTRQATFRYLYHSENGTWRARSTLELYQSYKEFDTVNVIKIQRIKWASHVVRMEEDRSTLSKVFNAQPIGTRRKGWTNVRWIDGLGKYLPVLRSGYLELRTSKKKTDPEKAS
ncbi:uncharacterized protein TNCV_2486711 [Trichonephila clavipes]|uniref:Uncharacterized protein n=1 Tax=Trichonephila clavipes TaxID=2585209 RepID=A0A8X6W072_TRICX|nr:uncharacterized protein TNCV_2486711 [Trichonephila clavipes]